MVECTAADLRRSSKWVQDPERVVDALACLIEKLRFRLILVGKVNTIQQKHNVGELMLRLMLAHAYQREPDYRQVDGIIHELRGLRGLREREGGEDTNHEA